MKEFWPGWETVEAIGSGGFSKVYKIRKKGNEREGEYYSALKVISIPNSQDEYATYYEDGYDDKTILKIFENQVDKLIEEFRLMAQFKGNSNIVSYEDHMILPHADGRGYDILIRMELLNSLTKHCMDNVMSEAECIKVGIDICRALELCQKKNIIHRDIKPQNIFVNNFGDFKLGDFGIARSMEQTTRATKTGTYTYMAPEVYHGDPYGSTIDLYSLGLVMYWLLNEKRLPFLPLPPEAPTASQISEAQVRRLDGEKLPPPKNGSENLKKIILKACAYSADERYATATEMRRALEKELQMVDGDTVLVQNSDSVFTDDSVTSRTKKFVEPQSDATEVFGSGLQSDMTCSYDGDMVAEKRFAEMSKTYAADDSSERTVHIANYQNPVSTHQAVADVKTTYETKETPDNKGNKKFTGIILSVLGLITLAVILFFLLRGCGNSGSKTDDNQNPVIYPTVDLSGSDNSGNTLASAKVGDIVKFGSYEQDAVSHNGKEDIEWIVLEKKTDRILVISKYALDRKPYNDTSVDVTWETSTLRTWLNSTFVNEAFSEEEQKMIPEVAVSADENSAYNNVEYGASTKDRVFVLSISEAKQYFSSDADRKCVATAYAKAHGAYTTENSSWWWLRTPGENQSSASGVFFGGDIDVAGDAVNDQYDVVRPVMWIDWSEENVSGSENQTSAPVVTITPTMKPTNTPSKTVTPTETPSESNIAVGETLTFGKYEQDNNTSNGKEDIEWIVLAKENGKMLLISKYALDCQPYNTSNTNITWENCTLRTWLNSTFINNAFSSAEKSRIPTVTVTAEDNPSYGTEAGNNTQDKVFLLSISEVRNYFSPASQRKCQTTDYAKTQGVAVDKEGYSWWWLRSPGDTPKSAAYIYTDSALNDFGCVVSNYDGAVRPVMWIEEGDFENSGSYSEDDKHTSTENATITPTSAPISTSNSDSVNVGDIITFGKYEQDNNLSNGKEDVEWIVLAKENNRILVTSKYALDCQPYNTSYTSITWENCTLRTWLNNTFINNAFSSAEKSKIPTVTVTAEDNPYGKEAGNNTQDKVFLLSISEADKYFSSSSSRMCYATSYAKAQGALTGFGYGDCLWWLRSPGRYQGCAASVYCDGPVDITGNDVNDDDIGVRPALWITMNP